MDAFSRIRKMLEAEIFTAEIVWVGFSTIGQSTDLTGEDTNMPPEFIGAVCSDGRLVVIMLPDSVPECYLGMLHQDATPRLVINAPESRDTSDSKAALAFSHDGLWLATARKSFEQDCALISIVDLQECASNDAVCTSWSETQHSRAVVVARDLRTPSKTTIRSIVFSPKNSDLYAGTGDGTVLVYSLYSGSLLRTIAGITGQQAADVLPQPGGKVPSSKQNHRNWISDMALSPGGKHQSLACVTGRSIGFVDLANDSLVRKVTNTKTKGGLKQNIKKACFSADSRFVCFVTHDGSVSVVDVDTGYQVSKACLPMLPTLPPKQHTRMHVRTGRNGYDEVVRHYFFGAAKKGAGRGGVLSLFAALRSRLPKMPS